MARYFFAALSVLFAIGLPCFAADQPAQIKPLPAAPVVAKPPPKALTWQQLSPAQKKLLAELEPQWSQLTDGLRNNLVKVADKYPKMKPDEQERVRRRVTRWASLTPQERDAARERYKQIKKQPPEKQTEVQKKWERYQNQKAPVPTPQAEPPAIIPSQNAPISPLAPVNPVKK